MLEGNQASLMDSLTLHALAVEKDGLAAAKVDIGWAEVIQALLIKSPTCRRRGVGRTSDRRCARAESPPAAPLGHTTTQHVAHRVDDLPHRAGPLAPARRFGRQERGSRIAHSASVRSLP